MVNDSPVFGLKTKPTVDEHPGRVYMKTRIGGERIVDMLTGEQLPRIC